jgi:hypothetical protein
MSPKKTSDSASANSSNSATSTTPATPAPTIVEILDSTRASIEQVDPRALIVIGIDEGDKSSPGYDPRVELPLDPDMVESMCRFGVVVPVIARRDGEYLDGPRKGQARMVVVDGRRRVIHARAAQLAQIAKGVTPLRIKTVLVRGDDLALFATGRVANAYRVNSDPVAQAKEMQRMHDMGASDDDIRIAFGVKLSTVQDRAKLLETAPEVQAKVTAGEITGNAALELASLPMGVQLKVLADAANIATEAGAAKPSTAHITQAVHAAKGADKPAKVTPTEKVKVCATKLEAAAKLAAAGGDVDWEKLARQLCITLTARKFDSLVKDAAKDSSEVAA